MFLHMTSSSSSLTLLCLFALLFVVVTASISFYVARRDLKFPMRLFEPLMLQSLFYHGYYRFRELAWGYSAQASPGHAI
jgi:hypothetical protein